MNAHQRRKYRRRLIRYFGLNGLINGIYATNGNATTVQWLNKSPKEIMKEVNEALLKIDSNENWFNVTKGLPRWGDVDRTMEPIGSPKIDVDKLLKV